MLRSIKGIGVKRAVVLSTTILLGLVGAVVLAGPAGAHDFTATATTTICDQTTGTYTVTYTGAGDYNLTSTVTASAQVPAASTVTGPQTIQAQVSHGHVTDPFTIVQSGIAGTATSASITITEVWSDKYSVKQVVSVTNLAGNCTQSATPTTPSFTNDACSNYAPTGSSYTIPATTGVVYKVGGTVVAAGHHAAVDGTSVTITAYAQPGYTLTGTTTFTHTFATAPTCTTATVATSPPYTAAV